MEHWRSVQVQPAYHAWTGGMAAPLQLG